MYPSAPESAPEIQNEATSASLFLDQLTITHTFTCPPVALSHSHSYRRERSLHKQALSERERANQKLRKHTPKRACLIDAHSTHTHWHTPQNNACRQNNRIPDEKRDEVFKGGSVHLNSMRRAFGRPQLTTRQRFGHSKHGELRENTERTTRTQPTSDGHLRIWFDLTRTHNSIQIHFSLALWFSFIKYYVVEIKSNVAFSQLIHSPLSALYDMTLQSNEPNQMNQNEWTSTRMIWHWQLLADIQCCHV